MSSTIEFGGVRLRPMQEQDQASVLAWRCDPAISSLMYTELNDKSLSAQLAWFRRVSASTQHEYWIIEKRGAPIGVANLAALAPEHGRADWAFYLGEPSARGSGAGAKVEYAVIHYVFFHRGLHKLCCQVLSNNLEVARMHQKFGFVEEGVLRRHLRRGDEWLDVHLLALDEDTARARGYDKKGVKVLDEVT
jgi:UDP-4-amino-4,6-dideoxy-N-acetyl-beta-L-altrosamine N-acetyltransferase